jgi:hypothetical protein
MKRYLVVLVFALLTALNSYAGQVDYTVAGTFSSDVPYTSLMAPNQDFKITFSIATPVQPNFVDSQGFEVDSQMTYVSGPVNINLPLYPGFYYQSQGGLFDLLFYYGSDSYDFSIGGSQLFTGSASSPTLLLGTFPIETNILYFDNTYVLDGTPGTVYATSPTPEPGTLLLLGSAVIGLARSAVRARR